MENSNQEADYEENEDSYMFEDEEINSGELISVHEGVFNGKDVICMSSVDSFIWVGGKGKIAVFNIQSQQYVCDISYKPTNDLIVVMTHINDGKAQGTVWAGHMSGKITVWDVKTRRLLNTLPTAHKKEITEIIQVKRKVWTASKDQSIRLWNIYSKAFTEEVSDHRKAVNTLCYVPETNTVWSGGDEDYLKLRDPSNGGVAHTVTGFLQGISKMRYSSGTIWIAGKKGSIFVFDAKTTQCIKEISAYKSTILQLSSTTKEVWGLGEDKVMKIFNVEHRRTMKNIFGVNKDVWVTCFVAVGNGEIWANCSDGLFRVWNSLGEKIDHKFDVKSVPVRKKKSTKSSTKTKTTKSSRKSKSSSKGISKNNSGLFSPSKTKGRKKHSKTHKPTKKTKKSFVPKRGKTVNRRSSYPTQRLKEVLDFEDDEKRNLEYQQELSFLRKQLEGATNRIGKYQNTLNNRKDNSIVGEDFIDQMNKKYRESEEKMKVMEHSSGMLQLEIEKLKMQNQKLENEKREFLEEIKKELNAQELSNLNDVSRVMKKNNMKREILKKELQYSKKDLLTHIQQLKQIHNNLLLMQKEMNEKDTIISTLNNLLIQTENKKDQEKVIALIESLKMKLKEAETTKKSLADSEEHNYQLKANVSQLLNHLKIIASHLDISNIEESNEMETAKSYFTQIEKIIITNQKNNNVASVKEMLGELRDYIKKAEVSPEKSD